MKSPPTSQKFTSDFQSMIQIVFWNSFGFMFFMFIIPYLTSQYFVISGTQIGLVIAAQPIARLITTPIVGYLTDKTSKKRLVLIGALGRTISYSIMYFSAITHSLWGFATGIFIQGLIVGFFWPPYNSLIAQKSSKYYRAEAYGKRSGMIGWGSFFGAIISYGIFNLGEKYFPNQMWISLSPFLIFAILNFYAGIKFYLNVDESIHFQESEEIQRSNSLPHEESSPNLSKKWLWIGLIFFVTASLIASMNTQIAMPFVQLYLFEITAQSTKIIMAIMYASQIFSLILSPVLGEYIDKIKPVLGITLFSLIGALQTFVFLQVKSLWALTLILILDYSIARASTLVIENFSSRVSTKHRGKIFGLNEWMKLVGWILGPIIGGVVWDSVSHQAPFTISIGVELVLIPIYLIGIHFLSRIVSEKLQSVEITALSEEPL